MKEAGISNQRKFRKKEVVGEEIKREMGLHDDQGKAKKGYLDAKWTAKCDAFLFEYDKLQAGIEPALGDKRYLLNPFQMICPICGHVKCLGNMGQLASVIQHISNSLIIHEQISE